jgi:rRNA maturation protein Nop10
MNEKQTVICIWCNQPAVVIWVHGHGQCSVCGINIDECCRGEEAHPPAFDDSDRLNEVRQPSQKEEEKDKSKDD